MKIAYFYLLLVCFLLSSNGVEAQSRKFDLLIRNAMVFDGSGGDSVLADVGITGERITFMGILDGAAEAERTIDAQGLYLAPGFIDPHTHYLNQLNHPDTLGRMVLRALAQGVTTVFEGNDGSGPIPVGTTLNQWDISGIGPNAGLFAGHNTIRRKVLGSGNVQPDGVALAEMELLVGEAMKEGAFGLSTGLFYNPGNFAKTEEVIALARVAAAYGGIYDTHQRDEGSQNIGVFNSSREVLEIAEKAHIPVNFSHIKVAGPQAWNRSGELIRMVETAREKGLKVTANQYPYVASQTGLHSALVPAWVLDGGVAAMRSRFRQPELRDSIIKGIHQSIQSRTADPAMLVLSSQDPENHARSLADLAELWDISPEEVVIKVCLVSTPSVHSFMMLENDIENFMKQPWVMTGSDGGGGHPRAFGSFARVMEEYALNRKVITVSEAIYKSSYLTAQTLQIPDRGLVAEGYFADLILFNPLHFKANSTYEDGEQLASGMQYVIINGKFAIDDGVVQKGLYGKALRLNEKLAGAENRVAEQVVIRRTDYGVPHIKAKNAEAAGYAMGYLQLEDYGIRVVNGLVRARGEWARFNELEGNALKNQLDEDAAAKLRYQRAVETFHLLNKHSRDLLSGYAQGINRYIELHPDEFPEWIQGDFSGMDVHAKNIGTHKSDAIRKFLNAFRRSENELGRNEKELFDTEWNSWAMLALNEKESHPDAGSNVWALAPHRTRSGNAILMRNPHLNWNAGYYEAQMEIEGLFNFYGDFRIGDPLGIVGGFNKYLGWSTTNNYTDNEEIYGLKVDPENPGHYLLDGKSHPIIMKSVEVSFLQGEQVKKDIRTFSETPYGPVIHQTPEHIYIIKSANDGEYRITEQFLRMMAAQNLEEWKDAMRMQARPTSNFTYADRDGHIFYVWNGSIPAVGHPSGMDTAAVYVSKHSEIWSELIPWDELPQLLDPKGGYVRNENDPFHYTNLNEVFDERDFPDNFPKAQLRLRSQLSLQLIANEDQLSLEEVIERKHDMTALLAYRVKDDLIRAVEGTRPSGKVRRALDQLKAWDNTVAAESRGAVIFEMWWKRYVSLAAGDNRVEATPQSAGYTAPAKVLFAQPWSKDRPNTTPQGLGSPDLASEAFVWAVEECEKQFGSWDLAWGEVYRARIGEQDYAVGGASGDLGAFRVLWFEDHATDPEKRQVSGGDGWVFAVEFGEVPRAYSILSYGQSIKPDSPFYADQLKMFTENKMKQVFYTEDDIRQHTIRKYHPGQPDIKD